MFQLESRDLQHLGERNVQFREWAMFQTLDNLRKLLPTAPGSKVWRQLVGVAASAEGLAPTRTSSGGSAAIIGLPSPTFPDYWIVVLTFWNGNGHFVLPMGGGCSFQVERVVLKLHKGPGAPVPRCKVGELSKTLEYDSHNDEDNDQICMSVKVMVCLCYGF